MSDTINLSVNLSKKDYEELMKKAEDNVRNSLTREAVKDYIKNTDWLDITELLQDLGIHSKYEAIKDTKVGDLTRNEKMIFMMYMHMYETTLWR